jgi:RPC5 protein
LLLQYPAHRPAGIPYNARNLQKPTSLRLKPSTGLIELDIPIDTKLNYNSYKGSAYATSLKRSRIAQEGGTHGLSGGFNTGSLGRSNREDEHIDMKTIPTHLDDPNLSVQTLGGKIVKPSPGDPIYMLGSLQNNTLHLSHLDALVQVRPELHHLDAADELERNRGISTTTGKAKGKDGAAAAVNGDMAAPPTQHGKPESKAIDIKLKPSGPSSHDDLSTNTNAKLLRAIQTEPWQTYEWVDEDDPESLDVSEKALHLPLPPGEGDTDGISKLESATSNSTYLDLLSAPRIEHGKKGDKGLMGKVRGRERERQRRKRNEAARRERAATAKAVEGGAREEGNMTAGEGTAGEETADGGAGGPSDEESSDDEPGAEEGGHDDVEMLDALPSLPQVDGADDVGDDDEVQEVERPDTATSTEPAPARRRGRPRKTQASDPIVLDD